MSQEPRIRFVKNGNVVGIVWEDTNGDLVLEESEGNNELRVTSVSAAAERVDADEIRSNNTSNVTLGSTLDADNNNIKNAGELESDSVNTDTLNGAPANVTVGASGEWTPLFFVSVDGQYSFTNTNYSFLSLNSEEVVLPLSKINLTNITSIGVSLAGVVSNDTDTETTRVRLSPTSVIPDNITISQQGFSGESKVTDIIDIGDVSQTTVIGTDGKVTGGQGSARNISVQVWGRIK